MEVQIVLKSFSVWECLKRLIELLHSSVCRRGGKGPMGMNQFPLCITQRPRAQYIRRITNLLLCLLAVDSFLIQS
jgi:hypothetical protein